jgi:hypothetical protein
LPLFPPFCGSWLGNKLFGICKGKLLCDFIEKFNMTFWNYIFMVGKKAFIPCERKLSDDVLRYFHGCIESTQSL